MMMTLLARLGRDPETRSTPTGTPVVVLALAYNYGRKDDDGKRPTQWVDASFFGDRAEKVAQYLTKGSQIVVHLDEVHVHTFDKKDGSLGTALRARVVDLEFAGGGRESEAPAKVAPKPTRAASRDVVADDLPF